MLFRNANVLPLLIQCRFLRGVRPYKGTGRAPTFISGDIRDDEIDFGEVRVSLLKSRQLPAPPKQLFPPDPDAPVTLDFNPYEHANSKCLLCELDIKLDYKNARLLQQFISSFSGRVYEQHITGLCAKQQRALLRAIALSRKAGYMPVMTKDPNYLRDPKLFDPLRPIRPHTFD